MNDLEKLIQDKKESKDYFTIREGLETEIQCFEAIEALGYRKYALKHEIDVKIKAGVDPEKDTQLKALVIAAQKVHQMQEQIVKDVCDRFEVIHPEFMNPSEELLKLKQPYWDWYRSLYQKVYHKPAPEII